MKSTYNICLILFTPFFMENIMGRTQHNDIGKIIAQTKYPVNIKRVEIINNICGDKLQIAYNYLDSKFDLQKIPNKYDLV